MSLLPKNEVPARALDTELFQELRESLGNELDVVAGIYRRFMANAASSVEVSLRQSGAERASTLHTLKGSAAMVGATRVAALSGQLQESLLESPDDAAAAALRELEAELMRFRAALALHLESLGHPK
jgi:HPt (histidine-containing phosphotransfer) domain-containing protein